MSERQSYLREIAMQAAIGLVVGLVAGALTAMVVSAVTPFLGPAIETIWSGAQASLEGLSTFVAHPFGTMALFGASSSITGAMMGAIDTYRHNHAQPAASVGAVAISRLPETSPDKAQSIALTAPVRSITITRIIRTGPRSHQERAALTTDEEISR